jgi:hypothetical protein
LKSLKNGAFIGEGKKISERETQGIKKREAKEKRE